MISNILQVTQVKSSSESSKVKVSSNRKQSNSKPLVLSSTGNISSTKQQKGVQLPDDMADEPVFELARLTPKDQQINDKKLRVFLSKHGKIQRSLNNPPDINHEMD